MGNSMYHEKFHSQGCHISIFLYNFDIQYLANWRLQVDTCVPTAGNGSLCAYYMGYEYLPVDNV